MSREAFAAIFDNDAAFEQFIEKLNAEIRLPRVVEAILDDDEAFEAFLAGCYDHDQYNAVSSVERSTASEAQPQAGGTKSTDVTTSKYMQSQLGKKEPVMDLDAMDVDQNDGGAMDADKKEGDSQTGKDPNAMNTGEVCNGCGNLLPNSTALIRCSGGRGNSGEKLSRAEVEMGSPWLSLRASRYFKQMCGR